MNTLVITVTEVAIVVTAAAFYFANIFNLAVQFDRPLALMLLS